MFDFQPYVNANHPDLFALIQGFIATHPQAKYTEINARGDQISNSVDDLHHASLRIHAGFVARGVTPNDTICVVCTSLFELIPTIWAAMRIGGVHILPVHINQATLARGQVVDVVADWAVRLSEPMIVTSIPLDGLMDKLPNQRIVDLGELLSTRETAPAPITRKPVKFLFKTSGTTARQKLVVVDEPTLFHRYPTQKRAPVLDASLTMQPFDGLSLSTLILPNTPQMVYLQPDHFAAQPLSGLRIIEQFKIPLISLSSSFAARVITEFHNTGAIFDLSHVKTLGFGAEMTVPTVVREMTQVLAKCGAKNPAIGIGYGMTEVGLICQAPAQSQTEFFAQTDVTSGPCRPGVSVRITDHDGNRVANGQSGRIEVHAPRKLFSGYYNDPAASGDAITHDGWFRTGDLGVWHNGQITVIGREKNTIISNGKNVALEHIEKIIGQIDPISPPYVAAVSARDDKSATDTLVVFIATPKLGPYKTEQLCQIVKQIVAERTGIAIAHLYLIAQSEFPFGPSGKLLRQRLLSDHQNKRWIPHSYQTLSRKPSTDEIDPWLITKWQSTFNMTTPPDGQTNLFAVGGDSLTCAKLVGAVEQQYNCRINLPAFYKKPTLRNLARCLENATKRNANMSDADINNDPAALRRKIALYFGAWSGERTHPDSLIIGANTKGCKPPLFLICQAKDEFEALAKQMGQDQPVYAMRSLVEVSRNYSGAAYDALIDHYFTQMQGILRDQNFAIMGVCQGGMIAVELAKRFDEIKRAPSRLILLEWAFKQGEYSNAVDLIYCASGPTVDIYQIPQIKGPDWRSQFPQHQVTALNCDHLDPFKPEYITSLHDALLKMPLAP
ncbi:AMP-binding protein [Paramylibacter kogurei]|uniref:AMP-binding protein n=1 Tax=Paramylibacter kogurei TaxID=1889778 RepID=UPI0013FDA372|nr:AMP-binding protein [Amylibacter kogurei]